MFFSTRSPKGLGHRAALGGLVACHLAVWGGVFFKAGAVWSSPLGDLDRHFMAWRIFAADQLRQGILPLWTPATLNGTPFLGGFESALLYPFNWLFTVLPPAPAANLVMAAQVLLAGLFTYGWAFSRGLRPAACWLAAMVASLGGPLLLQVYAGHLSNLCAMAWIPFLFWAFDEFTRRPSVPWGLGLALGSCLQGLAGHPQYVYETAILLGLYAVLSGAFSPSRRGRTFLAVAAYAAGFLLSAAQWLPGLQALEGSARGGLWDPKTSGLFSLPPENLLTLFLPDLFGPVGSNLYWGRWYLWDVSLFMGFTPLLLAAYALSRRGGFRGPDPWTALAAFLLALGPATPLFQVLFHFLPGFHSLRGTCKFDFFITLFLGLLAGSGLDRLWKQGRCPKGTAWGLGLTALAAAGLGLALRASAAQGPAGAWEKGWAGLPWLQKGLAYLDPVQRDLFARGAGARAAESIFLLALTAAVLAFAEAW
ncbi:MAG TPA: hypothetical protein VFR02_02980, partial [bacterium]|nr:hypothetical protein [bacterium]